MDITYKKAADLSLEDLENGNEFAPKFNADGLVTAIATEAETGTLLMVAFMNAEALNLTLTTGDVHYYSRSRQKIWKKGESSGEIQKLLEIRVDCDQDALQLIVEQTGHGAACHTGRKSCFYRRVTVSDGIAKLENTGDKPLFDPKAVYSS